MQIASGAVFHHIAEKPVAADLVVVDHDVAVEQAADNGDLSTQIVVHGIWVTGKASGLLRIDGGVVCGEEKRIDEQLHHHLVFNAVHFTREELEVRRHKGTT